MLPSAFLKIPAMAGYLGVLFLHAGQPADSRLARWGEQYAAAWYQAQPAKATLDGVHTYDGRLATYQPESLQAERRRLESFHQALDTIPEAGLTPSDRLDRQLALANLGWRRLNLDELRPWQTNPMVYTEEISNGLLWLAIYPTASAPKRLASLVDRERQVPRLLREARAYLQNPPLEFVEVARESVLGLVDLVGRDLPASFKGVGSPKLQREFRTSTARAKTALGAFLVWLDRDLQPRSKGSFALGPTRYASLLRLKEGITQPLAELEAMGQAELNAKETRFQELAKALGAKGSPLQVWETQRQNHPSAEGLLEEAHQQVERLERFVRDRDLMPIPDHQSLVVAPTPAALPGTFASQYMVGPFEATAVPARYFITLPDPTWSKALQEEHLAEYSRFGLWATSAHEAYPGHYLQGLYLRQAPSPFRAGDLFASDCLIEGWAHYCEQLMVEQGFLDSDPLFELAQVKESLLRVARYLVSIRLHTQGMSLEEATRFFMEHAYLGKAAARTEALRGTYEPTYLSYTYGKLELLRLRRDLQAKEGNAFSLTRFHERVLRTGQVPMWFLRASLLESQP